jgi:hypothetical protein
MPGSISGDTTTTESWDDDVGVVVVVVVVEGGGGGGPLLASASAAGVDTITDLIAEFGVSSAGTDGPSCGVTSIPPVEGEE